MKVFFFLLVLQCNWSYQLDETILSHRFVICAIISWAMTSPEYLVGGSLEQVASWATTSVRLSLYFNFFFFLLFLDVFVFYFLFLRDIFYSEFFFDGSLFALELFPSFLLKSRPSTWMAQYSSNSMTLNVIKRFDLWPEQLYDTARQHSSAGTDVAGVTPLMVKSAPG